MIGSYITEVVFQFIVIFWQYFVLLSSCCFTCLIILGCCDVCRRTDTVYVCTSDVYNLSFSHACFM